MKKRHYRGVELALLLAALLVTMLLACGCGAAVPGRQNADPASAVDPAPADPTTEATPPATGEDDGNILALWTQSQNRLSAYTEDGFYFLSHEKYLPGAMNIKYIDFATRQETFLCAVPNCTHDTDACTSYFVTNGACEIFYAYDHLFLLNHSNVQQNSVTVCDPDGGNARTLLTMEDGTALGNVYFGADRSHFYFVMHRTVKEDDGIYYHKSLQSLDLDTGALREVYAMDDDEYCEGNYGRYFFIRQLDEENECMHEYAIDLQGQRTDAIHMPPDWQFHTKELQYFNDGFICIMEGAPRGETGCTIRKWDVRTGKDTVLVDNMPVGSRQHVGHLVWRADVRHHALVLQP